ncbi:lytic murein transglycosylase [Cognatiyoonia koreensis]|uniref:Lytic murein transglycosylase n=1 Tax=Cognatiyoonia koreensis TaxID=364200 RepID=A0A1I0RCL4_9RHOB|nr:lytic murein transglycosylase [Cognatiyoonia koreensis]SEW38520.1 lytic murein transglycosylase [Cognatiyoonia koreensis]
MRLALAFYLFATGGIAQTCGGSLPEFISGIKAEAVAAGLPADTVERFFKGAAIDPNVLRADRSQSVFQRDFIDFSRRLISRNRIAAARANSAQYDAIFSRIEQEFEIPRGVILAFWAFETDFGAVQGDFNTRNALLTLAHDCRRPELFRPQLIAGIELMGTGNFDPATTTGAWAGEIGQVQMLPRDIIEYGMDGDGDGQVRLKTSAPDALISGANVLSNLGWRPNEPWLQEVRVPSDLDWFETGLNHPKPTEDWIALGVTPTQGNIPLNIEARVILPMGRNGPAFLAYPNFDVYFEWNQSFVYVLTAAYFGTRLEGAEVYNAGNPAPALTGEQITILQQKLANLGYDVGGIDGILGAKTREAVQKEQQRLGLPADAWPTREFMEQL